MFKPARLLSMFILLFAFSVSYGQSRVGDTLEKTLEDPKIHDTVKLYRIAMAIDQRGQFDQGTKHLNHLMGQLALQHYKKKQHGPCSQDLHQVFGCLLQQPG